MFIQNQLENLSHQNIFPDELIKSCDIGLSSVMIKKDLMNKFSFSNLKTKEDYLLWINLIKIKLFLVLINKPLVSWRKQEIHFQDQIFKN